MQKSSKTGLGIAVFLVVAIVVGTGLGLWISHQDLPKIDNTAAAKPVNTAKASDTNAAATGATEADPATAMTEEEQPAPAGWEQKLDDILLSNVDENAKALQILALMPSASEEGKVELAQHLCNLTLDENYATTGDLLTNPTTPKDVSNVLLNDLLNRNNNLKLPMLLAVARQDDHPLKGEAKEMLELFIQEDKGTNWGEWEAAIQKWLKDNQPEEAPADAASNP